MPGHFDPAAFPALATLVARLPELAGPASFSAGRDYLKKGLVKPGVVAGTVAHASVTGSTEYRVSITLDDDAKVTCSCPAHRRNKHCKHVVAVCLSLAERPAGYGVTEAVAAPSAAKPATRARAKGEGNAKLRAEEERKRNQEAGLALVDKLLEELTAAGIGNLGEEQRALLSSAADTVRGLKLRRLGNRLQELRLLAEPRSKGSEDSERGARLLLDIALTRQAVGAYLQGGLPGPSPLADELVGKTWRDSELEKIGGLNLVCVGREHEIEGEFKIDSSYLLDLEGGTIYVERQITPMGIRGGQPSDRTFRYRVDEAGLYPGQGPRRIKLMAARVEPLTGADVQRALNAATTQIILLRQRLLERARLPLTDRQEFVLFRPEQLVRGHGGFAALDRSGTSLPITLPDNAERSVHSVMPEPGSFALGGILHQTERGMALRSLAVFGHLRGTSGPRYPDVS